MGLFKNIISKIASVFSGKDGEIKSSKVLKMASLKKGASIEEAKNFEVAAVKHFDKVASGRTLQELVDYVKNLGNFVDASEFQDRMDVLNYQRKQASNDATKLTADGLFKYFAGGANLSEQDKKAYALIAKQTQAKARALAYIKANYIGICNMRDIYGEEGEKAFEELMKVVKEYADPDINGYTLPEFNPEIINSETAKADIYVKGASYAQKRCDALLAERVDTEVERAGETADAGKEATKIIKEYDAIIEEVATHNAAIVDIDEKLGQASIVSEKLAALKEEYDANEDEHTLIRNWVKGKDIVKPAAERRDEFMDAFLAIARDFPVAYYDKTVADGKTKGFSFVYDRNTLGEDLESAENGKFQVVFDKSLPAYDALVDAIAAYNADDTVNDHSKDIFKTKIEVGSDGKRKSYLYTTRQEKVMKNIFEIMKAHAQVIVNGSEYNVGDNLLKDFKYKNIKHSPNPKELKAVAEIIFGSGIEKGTTLNTTFENLTVDQLETLCNFIRGNEAVKAFIESSRDIRDFEIDSRLIDTLNPEVADKSDLKLAAVMNAMQREAIDSSIERVEGQVKTLKDDKEKHVAARDESYDKAKNGLDKLSEIKSNLDKQRTTAGDSAAAKETDAIRKQLSTRIGTVLSKKLLPEDKTAVDDKTKKIGNLKISRTKTKDGKKVKSTTSYVDEMTKISEEADRVSGAIAGEQSNIAKPGNSIETRAKYYKRYFSKEDSDKVLSYMADIESIIERIKAAQNAPVEEHEAE